ncbi:ATP-binding protein [Bacillus sp. REN3]|uniref:ATP-binding protein n=1 Tax=Bacillus sp. REN3 TaxID=2802440 RepID=UPI001AEF1EFB|nr:ATP-binding protein [Bacillus sp. REN3]
MNTTIRGQVLISEENKAIKLFIGLFYLIYIGYDFFYYFIFPYYLKSEIGLPDGGLGFFLYVLVFLPLPVAIYLIRKGNPFPIKYIFLVFYLVLEFTNYFLIYFGKDIPFSGGHVIELFFILFSPIFVNRKFFWLSVSSMILKYAIYGMVFQSLDVILASVLIAFISVVAFILLNRFYSYVKAITLAYEEARENEKLAVIGQTATAIAHEIKNPLSSLKGFTQLQQEKDKGDEQYYPIMLNEIDRINEIVNDLLILGKPHTALKKPESLKDIIEYVVNVIKLHADRQKITINVDIEDSSSLLCDEHQMKQVFINLIKNAMEAMQDGGTIIIQSENRDGFARISVIDEGCGIESDKLMKLGEPFYTTKQKGTGLGLMVTKKIIEEHEGFFSISSEINKGTTVEVSLPLVENGPDLK